jgi:hypothetical protein
MTYPPFAIEAAHEFRDEDIAYVRSERKFWSTVDQNSSEDKLFRKEAQRWVKVCTMVLEWMTGTKGGKPDGIRCPVPTFPLELHSKIEYLLSEAFNTRRPYSEFLTSLENK